jgi:hypothetical protein
MTARQWTDEERQALSDADDALEHVTRAVLAMPRLSGVARHLRFAENTRPALPHVTSAQCDALALAWSRRWRTFGEEAPKPRQAVTMLAGRGRVTIERYIGVDPFSGLHTTSPHNLDQRFTVHWPSTCLWRPAPTWGEL